MTAGTLYIIATPIGNLDDISARAVATLKSVDALFCEDTRETKKLCDRYGIAAPFESYREQVHAAQAVRVIDMLRDGKNVGLVSDAGTPGISDPGSQLVRAVLAADPEAKIVPIPGPSAVVAALSASGLPCDAFTFLGFPPHKSGRTKFMKRVMSQELTTVIYESPHRIEKALAEIAAMDPQRNVCVAREITKMFESWYHGTAEEVAKKVSADPVKGEYVVIIAAQN